MRAFPKGPEEVDAATIRDAEEAGPPRYSVAAAREAWS